MCLAGERIRTGDVCAQDAGITLAGVELEGQMIRVQPARAGHDEGAERVVSDDPL